MGHCRQTCQTCADLEVRLMPEEQETMLIDLRPAYVRHSMLNPTLLTLYH